MRRLSIILVIMFFGILAGFLFLINSFFGTLDPIKEYDFSWTSDDLVSKIIPVIKSQPQYEAALTDTVGFAGRNQAYHVEITDTRNSYQYNIRSEDQKHFWTKKESVIIKVISAWDVKAWKGGYSFSDPKVKELMDTLEINFISKLEGSDF